MGDVNCLRCKYRHTDNGNCTAVGGFCTAVPAAHCPLLRQYWDDKAYRVQNGKLMKEAAHEMD